MYICLCYVEIEYRDMQHSTRYNGILDRYKKPKIQRSVDVAAGIISYNIPELLHLHSNNINLSRDQFQGRDWIPPPGYSALIGSCTTEGGQVFGILTRTDLREVSRD